MLLFVYGTLRKGFCNHFLLNDAIFVSTARTVEHYIMYSADYPYVSRSSALCSIVGEVYEVTNEESWKQLDELEGHPNEYVRQPCIVELLASGRKVEVELYFNEVYPQVGDNVEIVRSGDFADAKIANVRRIS